METKDLRDIADHPAGLRWVDGVGLVECCHKLHPADHPFEVDVLDNPATATQCRRRVGGYGNCGISRGLHPTT